MGRLIFISFFLLSACNSKKGLQTLDWEKGDSLEQIQALNKIDLAKAQPVQALSQTVEIREQVYQGIPVEKSFVKYLREKDGTDLMVRAAVSMNEADFSSLVLKDFEARKKTLIPDLKSAFPIFRRNPIEKAELIISYRQGFYEPLWRVVYTDNKGTPWELKLNKHFEVRSVQRAGSQFHDTAALVFPKGPKTSFLQEVVLKGLAVRPALSNDRLDVSSHAEVKISEVVEPLKFNPQDTRFDQVQVFYFLEESLSWFEKRLGVKLPGKLFAEVHIGAPEKTNAAFYYEGKIRIGSGDDQVYSKIPQDPSIVIHESVHALVDAVARLPFEGEGGSLNEAFADFFTALQLDNPNMGEVAYLRGPFRRTLVNDRKLSDRNGGLYHDSGIVSGTLWSLRQKLGAEKAREIALLTLNRLTPMSDFQDFGVQLRDVLSQVLTLEELTIAVAVVSERGF